MICFGTNILPFGLSRDWLILHSHFAISLRFYVLFFSCAKKKGMWPRPSFSANKHEETPVMSQLKQALYKFVEAHIVT